MPETRARRSALYGFAVFALAFVWLSLRPSAPLHEDTSRDLAFARDLMDGAVFHQHGAWASFASLHQGTSFVDLLATLQLLGLGIVGVERVLTLLLAAAVALTHYGLARLLAPAQGEPGREQLRGGETLGPLVAAAVLLATLPLACELPILWQPILLPLPLVIAHLSAWRLLRDGALVDALALAVACALALDIHVVCVVLVGFAAFVIPLASARPVLASLAAALVGTATLALSSWDALTANFDILSERGWLAWVIGGLVLALGLGALARAHFAALSWPRRLQRVVALELALLLLLILATSFDATPDFTGRYLLPCLPALALAAALATRHAAARHSPRLVAGLSGALALVLLGASWPALRPTPERELPSYPEWRLAEFEPVAAELRARGLTWTEAMARLQGPSSALILGHLSSQLEPGSTTPARPESGLLLLGLEPDDAARVAAQLPSDPARVTRIELPGLEAMLVTTPARLDRLGAQLCRDGQDCTEVTLAVTSRVYQAHTDAWIDGAPALDWLRGPDPAAEPRELGELQWRVPVRPGPETVLVISSPLPPHCAWSFVAVEGFEAGDALPSPTLALPATLEAEGSVLVARKLDPSEWDCQEHGVLPPPMIETEPGWSTLRDLLMPHR